MAKKRLNKAKTSMKTAVEVREQREREKATSAAKYKKPPASPKKDKSKPVLPLGCKEEPSESNGDIVWRELQFNKEVIPKESLGPPFVFKDAVKSPRSSLCEMQLSTMFETPEQHNGTVMYASLTNERTPKDDLVSPMSRRPSRMSSFTSYSSVDNGYQITFSPIPGSESAMESEDRRTDFFSSTDRHSTVSVKVSELLNYCKDATYKTTAEKSNSNARWSHVPACCVNSSTDNNSVNLKDTMRDIKALAKSIRMKT
ncbi:unnamed protein product [Kluyveromyces dobzhanskii CBS 2104]|uniref:WGS project CCBQ000000000 data, contig 00058 n=1 Tax=Kluyveromyces dobzhanskii CBS 2104 TaxID=1427455 RepID=A0A0A8LBQ5_9SACH|nr:unnamed protein product [Kluyveromyces dobzhanskii CBS 2104]